MEERELKLACLNGDQHLVKLFITEGGVDPSADNNEAIIWASESGHWKTVKVLLEDDRVNPAARNNLALRLATRYGHTEVVMVLLKDPRVDPSCLNNKALDHALAHKHFDVARELLSDERVTGGRTETSLMMIKGHGKVDYDKHLQEHLALGYELFGLSDEERDQIVDMAITTALESVEQASA